jgi:hypothetical protein
MRLLAQWLEHTLDKGKDTGSNPVQPTFFDYYKYQDNVDNVVIRVTYILIDE